MTGASEAVLEAPSLAIRRWPLWAKAALFLVAYVGAARYLPLSAGAPYPALWPPTGIAVAAVVLFGYSFAPVIALGAALVAISLGLAPIPIVAVMLGNTLEAVGAAWLLRRWPGFDPALRRFPDVVALFVCGAVLAPGLSASIGVPFAARDLASPALRDGALWWIWWKMNALGVLLVTPVLLVWLLGPAVRVTRRQTIEALLSAVAIVAAGCLLLFTPDPGARAYPLAFALLPALLYPAVRFGTRGGATVALLLVVTILLATHQGYGPFQGSPSMLQVGNMQAFFLLASLTALGFGAVFQERERAQSDLQSSEATTRGILDAIPDIIYRIRRDGTYLSMRVPPGITPPIPWERMNGRTIAEVFPGEDVKPAMQAIAKALETKEAVQFEFVLRVDGRTFYREVRYVPIAPDEVLCVAHDITERRWTNDLLAWEARVLQMVVSERSLKDVLDALARGIEELVDGGLCTILLLQEGRLYQGAAPSTPPEYNHAVDGIAIGPVAGSCGTAAYRNALVVTDDIEHDPLWAEAWHVPLSFGLRSSWSTPIHDSAGEVLGTFAVYRREVAKPTAEELAIVERASVVAGIVLERDLRVQALRKSEERHRLVSETVTGWVYDWDLLRDRVERSPSFVATTGLVPDDIGDGKDAWLARIDPLDRERCHNDLQAALESAPGFNLEYRIRGAGDRTLWISDRGLIVRDALGRPVRVVGSGKDITAQRQLEEQLRQSQKMDAVGKLAGGVAHDFNNLLTAITGYTEMLLSQLPADSAAANDAQEIGRAASRAAALTRQLLAFSRKQILTPQSLELGAVIEGLGGLLRRLSSEEIQLVIRAPDGPAWVRADRGQLEQVIMNLALNARDAMPSGGTLTVAVSRVTLDSEFVKRHVGSATGRYVLLSVTDSGIGMDAETRSQAFEPFFTTKEQGKGTGLGLSTVYGIIKQSGGSVWIDSEPGSGTTVRVYLPEAAPAKSEVEASASEIPARGGEGTILLVEDEPVVRDLVRRTLCAAGYGVLVAENGEQALEIAHQHTGPLDLVLTDVIMPRMNGRELADRLTRERRGLRVLYVSGYTDDQISSRGVLDPGVDYLQKPFTSAALLGRVRDLLGEQRQTGELAHQE